MSPNVVSLSRERHKRQEKPFGSYTELADRMETALRSLRECEGGEIEDIRDNVDECLNLLLEALKLLEEAEGRQ